MEAEKAPGSSEYFHILTVRSSPADAIWVGETNLAALIDEA